MAKGLLEENPEGLQSTPRGRLSTQGTTRGHRFTWLPPMAFAQIVILSKFLGLAEDVALGLLSENPSGLQSTPRGRLITLGTTLGHRFTWLPPRLFHRLSHFEQLAKHCAMLNFTMPSDAIIRSVIHQINWVRL